MPIEEKPHLNFCCSVAHSCPTLCNPMDCNLPGFPVQLHFLKLGKLMHIESMMPSDNFVLYSPLLLLPSISCMTLCDPMDCSTPGFPVLHYLLEFSQSHVH